jgi:surface antigen
MKRIFSTVLTVATILTPATALAQPSTPSELDGIFDLKVTKLDSPTLILLEPSVPAAKPEKPVPVVYTVVEGDSLIKIGTAYNVEWQRLWAKNTKLKHPDVLAVGDKITIPLPDEKLKRKIPEAVSLPEVTPGVTRSPAFTRSAERAGNTYTYGYCTWHVKNMRPDLPNNLGNADTWYYRAKAQGLPAGTTPRVGAAAQTRGRMHVAYVTKVNKDGTVTVSEMNVVGWNVQSYATYPASKFWYIY